MGKKGGDDSSSREMIQMQKDEAADARKKAAERQARINSGLARIKGAFHGTEGKVNKTFDWGSLSPTQKAGAVPGMSGYSFVDLPAVAAVQGRAAMPGAPRMFQTSGGDMREGGRLPGTPEVTAVPGREAGIYIKGPDGKIYKRGDVVSASVGNGKITGGIGDDFYNTFKQGILDFYQPQVADKYADARKETTFRLADAGTLRSSAANELVADLAKQNALNTADVRSKADSAAADLRTRVAGEEAKATSQLFATENPDVAANQATHAVTNITAEKPSTTPLGDIFNIAAIGGAKFLQGADNAAFAKRVGGLPKPAQRIV